MPPTTKIFPDHPHPLLPLPSTLLPPQSHILTRTLLLLPPLQRLHPAILLADDTTQMHNILLRGLNAIILQAPHIPAPLVDDFLFFVSCWATMLLRWAGAEGRWFWAPVAGLAAEAEAEAEAGEVVAERGDVKQHASYLPGVDALAAYARTTPAEAYSPPALLGIADSFAPALAADFSANTAQLLRLTHLPGPALMGIYRGYVARAFWKREEAYTLLPLFFGLCDRDAGTEGGGLDFPRTPWWLAGVVGWWFAGKYGGSWRFLPCDFWGRRRGLEFV